MSAVDFFFLFFLHGTSIVNGQQGISYNVSWLCLVAEKIRPTLNLKQMSESTKPTSNESEPGLFILKLFL